MRVQGALLPLKQTNREDITQDIFFWSNSHFRPFGFLFIQPFGDIFGWPIFYFFGPLHLALRSSSNLYNPLLEIVKVHQTGKYLNNGRGCYRMGGCQLFQQRGGVINGFHKNNDHSDLTG